MLLTVVKKFNGKVEGKTLNPADTIVTEDVQRVNTLVKLGLCVITSIENPKPKEEEAEAASNEAAEAPAKPKEEEAEAASNEAAEAPAKPKEEEAEAASNEAAEAPAKPKGKGTKAKEE